MPSNYPPGGGFGAYDAGQVDQLCFDGHTWKAAMFDELGGRFYRNDDDSVCPTCGKDDILNSYQEELTEEERAVVAVHRTEAS